MGSKSLQGHGDDLKSYPRSTRCFISTENTIFIFINDIIIIRLIVEFFRIIIIITYLFFFLRTLRILRIFIYSVEDEFIVDLSVPEKNTRTRFHRQHTQNKTTMNLARKYFIFDHHKSVNRVRHVLNKHFFVFLFKKNNIF